MPEQAIPGAVVAQLQAILNQDADADRIALVWPEPIEPAESQREIANTPLHLVYCPSELAIRERLISHSGTAERLVILSPFDETRLGKDVLARLWANEPRRVSPWRTLEQLLMVGQIDPRLTGKGYRWIAELLVNTYDRYRGRIAFGEVLDFEKAWSALAIGLLDYRAEGLDLHSLFAWSLQARSSEMVHSLPSEMSEHLGDWFGPRLDAVGPLVQTLWRNGHASDMVAIGLVCSLLYAEKRDQTQETFQSRGRFTERFLGGEKFANSLLRGFGAEAVKFAEGELARGNRTAITAAITRAEQTLSSLDMLALAIESDLLTVGFSQRLDAYAKALNGSVEDGVMAPTLAAQKSIQVHHLASVRGDQVRTVKQAVRVCQWLHAEQEQPSGLAGLIRHYVAEGGYLDWARSRIWSGDEHEAISRVYQKLVKLTTQRREELNKRFGGHLPEVARGDAIGSGIVPVEKALDELVSPLAKTGPILFLVIDGMSQAVYRELSDDLLNNQWVELQCADSDSPNCLLSALPSITRVSRYALLAGALGEGSGAEEKKAFASHQGLKSIASTKYPPTLFHKADLQQAGGGGLSSQVRGVIASREHRVVGAVINAVDDQLSSNAQVSVEWRIDAVRLLGQVLEAARESGRIIIITSDHGHVLDHDMEYRKSTFEAERFKPAESETKSDEIMVEGTRVVRPGNRAVLPWSERVRYATQKMGYHGGGSLQEVIIPFGVFRNAGESEPVEGWKEVPRQEPNWWQLDAIELLEEPVAAYRAKNKPTKKRRDQKTVDLFAQQPKDSKPEKQGRDWIDHLLASAVYAQMKTRSGRVTISDEQMRVLLGALEARGGQQMIAAVSQAMGIPAIRTNGFLAGAQKLLNVDGYSVLSIDRSTKTVKLNIDSLKMQFEI